VQYKKLQIEEETIFVYYLEAKILIDKIKAKAERIQTVSEAAQVGLQKLDEEAKILVDEKSKTYPEAKSFFQAS
jgi:hypothetical protein